MQTVRAENDGISLRKWNFDLVDGCEYSFDSLEERISKWLSLHKNMSRCCIHVSQELPEHELVALLISLTHEAESKQCISSSWVNAI